MKIRFGIPIGVFGPFHSLCDSRKKGWIRIQLDLYSSCLDSDSDSRCLDSHITVLNCLSIVIFIRAVCNFITPKGHIINYGRGGTDMLVGGITKFHHPFMGGITKFQVSKMGGITKFTLTEVHKIDFYTSL